MAALEHVADHLPLATVYERLKVAAGHWRYQKWLVVHTALARLAPFGSDRPIPARRLGSQRESV